MVVVVLRVSDREGVNVEVVGAAPGGIGEGAGGGGGLAVLKRSRRTWTIVIPKIGA